MSRLTDIRLWLSGWRYDYEDWIVRARRETDPEELPSWAGFVEESAIAVRTPAIALSIDRRAFDGGGNEA